MQGLLNTTSFVESFNSGSIGAGASFSKQYTMVKNRGTAYGVAIFFADTSLDDASLITCTLNVNGQNVIEEVNAQRFYYNAPGRKLYYPVDTGGGSTLFFNMSGSHTGAVEFSILVFYKMDAKSLVQRKPIVPPINDKLTLKLQGYSGTIPATTTEYTTAINEILPDEYGTATGFGILVDSTIATAVATYVTLELNGIEVLREINGLYFYATADPKINFFPFQIEPSAPFKLKGINSAGADQTIGIDFRFQ